jgi:hypothetical protein
MELAPWMPAFAEMTEKGAATKHQNRTTTTSAAVNLPVLRSAEPGRIGACS